MKEKRLLKKVWRYHRISNNKRLEAIICLYKDCLYIKVDMIYEDLKARETYYESYISCYERFENLKNRLVYNDVSEKLTHKIYHVILTWSDEGFFSFPDDNIIQINGGQIDDKQ